MNLSPKVPVGGILSKYFAAMLGGFTGNYFFEFEKGQCMFRHLTTTADVDVIVHPLCGIESARSIRTVATLWTQSCSMVAWKCAKLVTRVATLWTQSESINGCVPNTLTTT